MAEAPAFLAWPAAASPVLVSGGRFPMPARNPECVYFSSTVAIHLNDHVGRFWVGSREFELRPGDLTLTPARTPSRYDLSDPGHHLCVHFRPVPGGRGALSLPVHWRTGSHERQVRDRLQDVLDLFRAGDGEGPAAALARKAASACLQALLVRVAFAAGCGGQGDAIGGTRVDRVVDALRRRLDQDYRRPFDVARLARELGVSQNYLARRFQRRHGMTMKRYVLGRRIELARHLLAVTRLPIKAVAIEAGFANPQYFHRQFRRQTGRSPGVERAAGDAA